MTDTLIQRLRRHRGDYVEEMDEAADALEQQAAQIEALRAALREVLEFQSAPTTPTIHDFGRWRRVADAAPSVAMNDRGKASDAPLDDAMKRAPMKSVKFIDAVPSVAPEPVAWTTQLELNWIKNNTGRAGSFYAVKAGPNDIPLFAHPPRAPLSLSEISDIVSLAQIAFCLNKKPSFEVALAREVEAAHGINAEGEKP